MTAESRWVFIYTPLDQPEGVTHYPPGRTLCERTVAAVIVLAWKAQVELLAGTKLAEVVIEPTEKGWLDLGGIARIDQTILTLRPFDGLTLSVPARHVGSYLDVLEELTTAPRERVAEQLYVTVPAMRLGIFLSVGQCAALAEHLREVLAEAKAVATIENDQFNKMIAKTPHVIAPLRPVGPIGDA